MLLPVARQCSELTKVRVGPLGRYWVRKQIDTTLIISISTPPAIAVGHTVGNLTQNDPWCLTQRDETHRHLTVGDADRKIQPCGFAAHLRKTFQHLFGLRAKIGRQISGVAGHVQQGRPIVHLK